MCVIIISTILIQRFVDCVCICHLRKARPPIRSAFPPIHSRPIDSLPIWVILCQYGQYTAHMGNALPIWQYTANIICIPGLSACPYGWHLSETTREPLFLFCTAYRFKKRIGGICVALLKDFWVAPVYDLLLACPYTSRLASCLVSHALHRPMAALSLVRRAYVGHP